MSSGVSIATGVTAIVPDATSIGAVPLTSVGAASGVASLGSDGLVPTAQLPFAALDAMQAAASTAVALTPTVLILPTVNSNQNITYNTSTGEITFVKGGDYSFAFMFNVQQAAGANTLFYGADLNTGSGYTALTNAGRQAILTANTTNQILFVSENYFAAGTLARIYIWATGACNFITSTLTALPSGTHRVVGVRMLISGG